MSFRDKLKKYGSSIKERASEIAKAKYEEHQRRRDIENRAFQREENRQLMKRGREKARDKYRDNGSSGFSIGSGSSGFSDRPLGLEKREKKKDWWD